MDDRYSSAGRDSNPVPGGRLDSWKEIATYLNRGVRTVIRWEREEGLPVRRLQHDKRGSVYAYKTELDAWQRSRSALPPANGEPPPSPGKAPGRLRDALRRGYRFIVPGEGRVAPAAAPAVEPARARIPKWRWVASFGVAAVAMIVAALAWWGLGAWRHRLLGRAAPGAIESLAVLPLANLSGDPTQDYFADGMTDALIADLAQIGSLRVISRTTVMQFTGTRKALPQIARELKVDAVLEGSVLRAGNRVRITAQLIEGATDRHLWAQNYERDLTDVLALQGEVARAVASQIRVRLTPQEQTRLAKVRAVKPEAYEYYLRGIHLPTDSKSKLQDAIGMLERAVEIDPGFALAHAALAGLCVDIFSFIAPEEQAQWEAKARAAVDEAVALDPDQGEAYVAGGRLIWTPSNHFPHDKAIREFRRALALKPNSSDAHAWLAAVYDHVGLLEEGLRHSRQALAIDPSNRIALGQEAMALTGLGKYDEALSIEQRGPQMGMDALFTAYYLPQARRLREIRAVLPEIVKEYPEDPGGILSVTQALLFAADGKQAEAEAKIRIAAQKKAFGHFHHTAFGIACAYAQMNKPQKAMAWLEQAADAYPCYPAFERAHGLDPLRKEPGFIAFLERVKKESDYYRAFVANQPLR